MGYSAHGYGGQYLYVFPETDLVIVTNSNLDYRKLRDFYAMIARDIPQSMISSDPLPENEPAAQAS